MSESIGSFRTMVLNMSLGVGSMTPKQVDYIVRWAENNISKTIFNKLAEIAWQYDQDDLKKELMLVYNEYMQDLENDED